LHTPISVLHETVVNKDFIAANFLDQFFKFALFESMYVASIFYCHFFAIYYAVQGSISFAQLDNWKTLEPLFLFNPTSVRVGVEVRVGVSVRG
jgi:hypothetical protein